MEIELLKKVLKIKTRRMYITNYRTAFLFMGFVFNGQDTKRQEGRERRNEIRMWIPGTEFPKAQYHFYVPWCALVGTAIQSFLHQWF